MKPRQRQPSQASQGKSKAAAAVLQGKKRLLFVTLFCLGGVLWIHYDLPRKPVGSAVNPTAMDRRCRGQRIHVYDLPAKFNQGIVDGCKKLEKSDERCKDMENGGMGQPYGSEKTSVPDATLWYNTHSRSLEILIHHRLLSHHCVTHDPTKADLFFIPYYPGLEYEQTRYSPLAERDALTLELAAWLRDQPTFQRYNGSDHFMAVGEAAFNLMRDESQGRNWGAMLEMVPEFQHVTKLELEPEGRPGNYFGVPYPTDFHPTTFRKLRQYQAMVNTRERKYMFGVLWKANESYADEANSVRLTAVKQCEENKDHCLLLDCRNGCSHAAMTELWLSVKYAVQDNGGMGLRHTFDAMVAGAVPIIMWERMYELYMHYLPASQTLSMKHGDKFSVFLPFYDIPEWAPIMHRIAKVGAERYDSLRRQIVRMIPSLLYFDPQHTITPRVRDAFDTALQAVVERAAKRRSEHIAAAATAAEAAAAAAAASAAGARANEVGGNSGDRSSRSSTTTSRSSGSTNRLASGGGGGREGGEQGKEQAAVHRKIARKVLESQESLWLKVEKEPEVQRDASALSSGAKSQTVRQ